MSNAETKIVSQGQIYSLSDSAETVTPVNIANKASTSNLSKFLFQYGRKQSFGEGQYIIREGLYEKTVFIILQGEVEILKKDDHGKDQVIATLSDGGVILGEMSIFLNQPRSTSVRVVNKATALEFTGDNFLKAVVNMPELSMRIMKSLSNKLKRTNDRVIEGQICPSCRKKKNQTKTNKPVDDQDETVIA